MGVRGEGREGEMGGWVLEVKEEREKMCTGRAFEVDEERKGYVLLNVDEEREIVKRGRRGGVLNMDEVRGGGVKRGGSEGWGLNVDEVRGC